MGNVGEYNRDMKSAFTSTVNRFFSLFFGKQESVMFCRAFIIDFLGKRYMFHIWLHPHFALGWHRKRDDIKGKLLWVVKY